MGTGQAYTPLRERLHTLLLVSTVGAGALVLFFLRLSAEAGHQIHPSAASFNFDLDSVELSTLLEEARGRQPQPLGPHRRDHPDPRQGEAEAAAVRRV